MPLSKASNHGRDALRRVPLALRAKVAGLSSAGAFALSKRPFTNSTAKSWIHWPQLCLSVKGIALTWGFTSRSPFIPLTSSRICRHVSRLNCSGQRHPSLIRPVAKSASALLSAALCAPLALNPATFTGSSDVSVMHLRAKGSREISRW